MQILSKKYQKQLAESFDRYVGQALQGIKADLSKIKDVTSLKAQIQVLEDSVTDLTVQKSRKEEEFAKREREVEHMIGLEKSRHEFEVDKATQEAVLTVREENLATERKAFEDQMKFNTDRFEAEVKYQRELLQDVLKQLPSAEIIANIGGGGEKKE